MQISERKNCHKLVGLRIARLLINMAIIPTATAVHPKSFILPGAKTSKSTPDVNANTEISAEIPRHQ